jgi:hypothetical protein
MRGAILWKKRASTVVGTCIQEEFEMDGLSNLPSSKVSFSSSSSFPSNYTSSTSFMSISIFSSLSNPLACLKTLYVPG